MNPYLPPSVDSALDSLMNAVNADGVMRLVEPSETSVRAYRALSDAICEYGNFVGEITGPEVTRLTAALAAAEARAEKAEAKSSEVLSALEAIRAHFLSQIAAGKVGPMPICGWCGEPQRDIESFRSHAVECAKNPSVARAESAEARVAELEGAARGVLATDMGYEWEGTGTGEERAIVRLRRALASKERSR